ncbi:YihY family inner membrane protein [Marinihelvus fidelis]|nr:YihY family inner membrane protein [Marinihelvus fidelis]
MSRKTRKTIRQLITEPRHARRIARHVWRHFKEDRCFDEAASLSYTSLLSLVPLLAVMFGVASAFPVFDRWSTQLRSVIYANLVPDAGAQLGAQLDQFISSVAQLTLPGTLFLVVTALLLMMRIERSFNRVWRVPVSRGIVNRVTMYWAVLTLGPLALGAATALSAQPLFDFLGGEALVDANFMRGLGVFMLTWLAFCMMFILVPNCRVPFAYGAVGSLLSTVLFTIAKVVFVAWVSRANYRIIYGAMASVPIFLLWLYLVWTVILLGASLSASLTSFRNRHGDWEWPRAWELLLVIRVLGHFYRAQEKGTALGTSELLELEPGLASARALDIMTDLVDEKLLTSDQEENWVLLRDLSRYSLGELYRAGDYHLPIGKDLPIPNATPLDRVFTDVVNTTPLDLEIPVATILGRAAESRSGSQRSPDGAGSGG